MGRSRKNLYYGSRDGSGRVIRKVVSNRTSPSARPWNDPDAVSASDAYGVNLDSHNEVASHEDKLESKGLLKTSERRTCIQCARFNKDCQCTEEWK